LLGWNVYGLWLRCIWVGLTCMGCGRNIYVMK
jgi:hypothetical protein